MEERKRLFKKVDAANITEYREKSGDYMQRIVFACDEVAELLDKTGADKDGRAAEQIPHDAQGRFIMEDGTVFQAYYFNDDTISKW